MKRFARAEFVLPLTIAVAALVVAASEFMTTFEFTIGGASQASSLASDRHGYALLILAVLTIAGTAYAIATGLRAAAFATAGLGLTALLLFLVLDLPDAGKVGPLDDELRFFASARADPGTGFWLEAIGTVVLGLATVAFATLSSAQLRAPAELIASRRVRREEGAGRSTSPGRSKDGRNERAPGRSHGPEARAARRGRRGRARAQDGSSEPRDESAGEPQPGLLRRLRGG